MITRAVLRHRATLISSIIPCRPAVKSRCVYHAGRHIERISHGGWTTIPMGTLHLPVASNNLITNETPSATSASLSKQRLDLVPTLQTVICITYKVRMLIVSKNVHVKNLSRLPTAARSTSFPLRIIHRRQVLDPFLRVLAPRQRTSVLMPSEPTWRRCLRR